VALGGAAVALAALRAAHEGALPRLMDAMPAVA
jgi:hypothetical protein